MPEEETQEKNPFDLFDDAPPGGGIVIHEEGGKVTEVIIIEPEGEEQDA